MLKNRKDHKLASTLSNESQLLQLTEEDIALKRKLLERIESSDEEFKESLATPTQVFSCEYCKIYKNTCIEEDLRASASGQVAECFPRNYYQNINQTINSQSKEEQRCYYNL